MGERTLTQRWYDQYLQSPHWIRMRDRKLEAAGYQCEQCGQFAKRRGEHFVGLHVHHKTYARVNREELDDLIVLCVHCHEVQHGAPDTEAHRMDVERRLARVWPGTWEDEIDAEIAAWDELAEAAGL